MTSKQEEIFRVINDNIETIRGFGVKKLGLFGSYARGDESPDSDMDFVVEFEKITFDAFMGLVFYLEELFGCDVDLIISRSIRPELRNIILSEVIYVPGI